jgi:CBS domain-containing protein
MTVINKQGVFNISEVINQEQAGTEIETAAGCGITGDPWVDEMLDKYSVLGNNPAADAVKKMRELIPPSPVIDDDEDGYEDALSDGDSGLAVLGKAALGIGITAAVIGAGLLAYDAIASNA